MKTRSERENKSWKQAEKFPVLLLCVLLLCLTVANGSAQTYTILHHFDGANGWDPVGDLTASGTTLFGTTYWGGAGYGNSGAGTVFKISLDGSGFTVLKRFIQNDRAGSNPGARLLLVDTMLYGTTSSGGISNRGTVFKLSTDGSAFNVLKE